MRPPSRRLAQASAQGRHYGRRPHLGRLPTAPDKHTCRTGDMGMQHAASLFLRSKMGSRWETVGVIPCVVRRSLGYDSKDLSEINYLGLLLSQMSRTVKVSDHGALTLFPTFRHSVPDSTTADCTSARYALGAGQLRYPLPRRWGSSLNTRG
jgi:hypothetical protein